MTITKRRSSIVAVCLALATAACVNFFERSRDATAAQGDVKGKGTDQRKKLESASYMGAAACGECHTTSAGRADDFVLLNEFATWRTQDKHALAYVVLEGPRGQQMTKLLGFDVTKDARCLNCHATTSRSDRGDKSFTHREGVSCDGCHGPAEYWLFPHAFKKDEWREKTPAEKEELGMFDVRNPVKRAQLCLSCHVGNTSEGKVVTHEMYAAGHPPLPNFETANFSANLPAHWRSFKDVPYFKTADAKIKKQNYGDDAQFHQTKLVLASCSEPLRSMMSLLSNRGNFSAKLEPKETAWPPVWLRANAKNEPHDRWPEIGKKGADYSPDKLQELWPELVMTHADCYGCHHDLKAKSWRQEVRGYIGRPGRPQIQSWPIVLASVGLTTADDADLAGKIKKLHEAMDSEPFGVPHKVVEAAIDLEHFSASMMKPTTVITREIAEKLLKRLLARGVSGVHDFDSARQIASAARVVFLEWEQNHPKSKEIHAKFGKLDDDLNITLASKARKKTVGDRYKLTENLAGDKDAAGKIKVNTTAKFFEAKTMDADFMKKLKEISDEEISAAMGAVREYEPMPFRATMQELTALIFSKGKE